MPIQTHYLHVIDHWFQWLLDGQKMFALERPCGDGHVLMIHL
jgi:hypothetical protein